MPEEVIIVDEETTTEPVQETVQETPAEPVQKPEYKDPKTHTPPVGSPKWNQVYKGYKQNENTRAENEALRNEVGEMKSMMKTLIDTQAQIAKQSKLDELTKRIELAYQDGNTAEVAKLNTEYLNSSVQQQAPKPEMPQKKNEIPIAHQVAATIFEQNNEWYGQDEELSNGMNWFMSQIKDNPSTAALTPTAQLNEAKKRLQSMYPDNPYFSKQQLPTMGVGQVGNGAPAPSKQITITRQEINNAKMFLSSSYSEKQIIDLLTKQKKGEL